MVWMFENRLLAELDAGTPAVTEIDAATVHWAQATENRKGLEQGSWALLSQITEFGLYF